MDTFPPNFETPPSTHSKRISYSDMSKCGICKHTIYSLSVATTDCPHTFCGACLMRWTNKTSQCPTCKKNIGVFVHFGNIVLVDPKPLDGNWDEEIRKTARESLSSIDDIIKALQSEKGCAAEREKLIGTIGFMPAKTIEMALQFMNMWQTIGHLSK